MLSSSAHHATHGSHATRPLGLNQLRFQVRNLRTKFFTVTKWSFNDTALKQGIAETVVDSFRLKNYPLYAENYTEIQLQTWSGRGLDASARVKRVGETQMFDLFGMWQDNNKKKRIEIIFQKGENDSFLKAHLLQKRW